MAAPVTLLPPKRPTCRRRRTGAAFIWFLLVALPMLAFGSTLAVDVTRLIIAAREMSNATEAAAVAGAQQFLPNTWRLDIPRAQSTAEEAMRVSEQVRAVKSDVNTVAVVVTTSPTSPTGNNSYQQVTVATTYTVDGLVFSPLLAALVGGDGDGVEDMEMVRSADVCIPGRYTPTQGSCTRPTLR